MKLTAFTDYSLRVLMYLAVSPDQRATIAEIAAAYGISEHHLVKIVHLLGREGILLNTRGRHGGLRLARLPAAITIGEVVRLTEGEDRPAECFDASGSNCAISGVCRLRHILQESVNAFHAVLDGYTLEDLSRRAPRLSSILHVQARVSNSMAFRQARK